MEEFKKEIFFRIEQAKESLESSKLLLSNKHYMSAVNRAYYVFFYSIQSLIYLTDLKTSKHSGNLSIFDLEFVKKGIFPKEMSKWAHKAFDLRNQSDYLEMEMISYDDVFEVVNNSENFYNSIIEYYKAEYSLFL